jgi:mannose-6-phosphate isomerase-like protein (cupin superfamily)
MNYSAINLRDKLAKFADQWAPKVVAEMNDYPFKLAKIQGEFVWHSHAHTDEVFIILEGEIVIGSIARPQVQKSRAYRRRTSGA